MTISETPSAQDAKGIPDFWLTIFKNVDMINISLQVSLLKAWGYTCLHVWPIFYICRASVVVASTQDGVCGYAVPTSTTWVRVELLLNCLELRAYPQGLSFSHCWKLAEKTNGVWPAVQAQQIQLSSVTLRLLGITCHVFGRRLSLLAAVTFCV